ncbi:MAG: NUDIX domain-containing protein [Proteobacteria bacterium]|jgi:isopentenyldiphosphate isomerase|nr:NUDIX domain-containing protein [Pseudomonadota bacterium]
MSTENDDLREQAEPSAELLEVVDDDGDAIGLRRRDEIHSDPSLQHRAIHILVFNDAGELFLQQRSRFKRIQPGRWDSSVGGHVDPGESYEEAAVREVGEELGVTLVAEELNHLHDYLWRTSVETEHVRTFRLAHEGPFSLHPAEIDDGRFWSVDELREEVGSGKMTPNLEHELCLLGLASTRECQQNSR